MREFIPIANTFFGPEEAEAVRATVASGWITMGRKVAEFEANVASYVGTKHAIAMNNGTSTLHAMLMALNVGPGDEVIVPSMTYISTANVVLLCGATPVLCECDPLTYNARPEDIRAKITPRTKAFITVDMKGMAVDYDAFNALAQETGLPFLADSAEALGAQYKGRPVGRQAVAHSYSFFANKNITTGEGGMVVTDDDTYAEKLRIIRNQGQEGRYNHTFLGHNYRMTDIAATIGIEQFKRVEWLMAEKVKMAKRYDDAFATIDWVQPPFLPAYATRHTWYMYCIRVPAECRDAVVKHLHDNAVDTRLSFPPVHIQPYYAQRFDFTPEMLPLTMQAYEGMIDIPCWVGMTEDQQEYVIATIRDFQR